MRFDDCERADRILDNAKIIRIRFGPVVAPAVFENAFKTFGKGPLFEKFRYFGVEKTLPPSRSGRESRLFPNETLL